MKNRILSISSLVFIASATMAQGKLVDSRDQAEGWYLPVVCDITANGGKTNNVTVTLFKDNEQVTELAPDKHRSSFQLDLDINNQYTIRVQKEGYREKLIYVDTNLPENQVEYKQYVCHLNLEPLDKFTHADQFYLDFPSSIVRWNDDLHAFMHNDEYLSNIQLKVALLGAQLD